MEKIEWDSKTVKERMATCYNESDEKDFKIYALEERAILTIGLYKAYQDKWGT
jgi:hypothetical protein